jgi:hypothetical protein
MMIIIKITATMILRNPKQIIKREFLEMIPRLCQTASEPTKIMAKLNDESHSKMTQNFRKLIVTNKLVNFKTSKLMTKTKLYQLWQTTFNKNNFYIFNQNYFLDVLSFIAFLINLNYKK